MKILHLILILFCLIALPSCSGTFQQSIPLITSEGYILFSTGKGDNGELFFVGGSPSGLVLVQWTQADGTKARMVKPKGKDIYFATSSNGIQWRRVSSKEPVPIPPEGASDALKETVEEQE